jgi:hypothetical protein
VRIPKLREFVLVVSLVVASSLCVAQTAPAKGDDTSKIEKKTTKKAKAEAVDYRASPRGRWRQGVGEHLHQSVPQRRR